LKSSPAAPEEGNVQPGTNTRIDEESDDEESAIGLHPFSAAAIFGGPDEEVGNTVQPKDKDTTPVILIPVVVKEAGILGIRLSSTCPFACVEEILPTANAACRTLEPGDVLAPYQPTSTKERPTPYTLDEFTSLVASNDRPLRFVAVRSSSDSAGTLDVVHTDMISDEITM
jgi:hypothetical protein